MSALKIVSAAVAALILITSAGCASTKEHESTGQYFDDSVITTKVKSAIMADDSLKVSEINVEISAPGHFLSVRNRTKRWRPTKAYREACGSATAGLCALASGLDPH